MPGEAAGVEATIFYLLAYSAMTIGAFAVLLAATASTENQYDKDSLDSFKGLGWKYPFLGLCMTVFMLSLAGMPPFVGFIGKFYLFSAAVQGGFVGLAVIAALNSVVSLYYYLRVIVAMYFDADADQAAELPAYRVLGTRVVLAVTVFATIYFGIFSERFYSAAAVAVEAL